MTLFRERKARSVERQEEEPEYACRRRNRTTHLPSDLPLSYSPTPGSWLPTCFADRIEVSLGKTKAGFMADRSSKPPDMPAPAADSTAELRLAPQMLMMFWTFWASPQRNKVLLLGVALVAVIGGTAFGQVKLNAWNQPFYDALSHKDLRGLLDQFKVFGVIAGGLLVLNVVQAWLNQTTKVKLREWLVCDLFDEWLKPRRAFHL